VQGKGEGGSSNERGKEGGTDVKTEHKRARAGGMEVGEDRGTKERERGSARERGRKGA
jgi:hypothetical protein